MKLISWNVNGIRACLTKGFEETFQNLDADVGGAWILRLRFACRILPFPFRLTQPVRLVPLLDVCEDVVDGFLDGSLADTHGGNQYVHEGRLVLHIVPIAEFDPMQVGA